MKIPVIFFILLFPYPALAQQSGHGSYQPKAGECLSAGERARIEHMLDSSRRNLIKKGILPDPGTKTKAKVTSQLFDWPLQQAAGFNYRNVYGISNYVDHDPAYPNKVKDWDCGTRTYDLSSGYNHAGTDIFLWPFDWNMMQSQQVKIVAAAPGIIIGKDDGHYDMECTLDSPSWNAVYIQHSDGSIAWYGHMKKNTQTAKAVGSSITTGEFLGFVGSSGSSTGPHLHFEVHDPGNNVVDPFSGSCNTAPSLWNAQKPYYESGINAVLTQSAAPVYNPCPQLHNINSKDTFLPGSNIYFAAYFHDQLAGQIISNTIYRPDSSIFNSWTSRSTVAHYAGSYWYNNFTIPATEPTGKWQYEVFFNGETEIHDFWIQWPLGIRNAGSALEGIKIYPSVVSSVLNIDNSLRNAGYQVIAMNGYPVMQGGLVIGINNIDASKLPPGMYLVNIANTTGRGTYRFVKD